MTAGGGRYLAVAASLALHAGVFALAWQWSSPAPPPLQMTAMQFTLQAPPGLPSLSQGRGDFPAVTTTARVEPGTAAPVDPRPLPAAASAIETDALPADRVPPATAPLASRPASRPEAGANGGDRPEAEAADMAIAAVPPGTSPPIGSISSPSSSTRGQVLASVEQAFHANFYYPTLARRKGWEGEVTLAVRVESDGRLTGIHVVGSSGYRVLDHAAMDTLLRARAVALPGGALVDGLDMLLPVQYHLLDARV